MPDENKEKVIYYTAEEALARAQEVGISCTYQTMLSWVEKNGLGFQPGGIGSKWHINKDQFEEFIHGTKKKSVFKS